MENSILVVDFINQIWNNRAFEKLDSFLHPHFKDFSLPATFSPDKEGTKKWIIGTGESFDHHTIIEDQVTDGDKSIIKIRMNLRHVGIWRGIKPTGIEIQTIGYRYFKFKDGKIIEHWALIDGQAIEHRLRSTTIGCKVAE